MDFELCRGEALGDDNLGRNNEMVYMLRLCFIQHSFSQCNICDFLFHSQWKTALCFVRTILRICLTFFEFLLSCCSFKYFALLFTTDKCVLLFKLQTISISNYTQLCGGMGGQVSGDGHLKKLV